MKISGILSNSIGWFLEKGMTWGVGWGVFIIFGVNKLAIKFWGKGSEILETSLYKYYDLLIAPNVGTITTIAAIFVGIYITILSVLGGIRANSIMAMLNEKNLKKFIFFLSAGLIGAFNVVFYSLFAAAIDNRFVQALIFFILIIYMLLSAFRLCTNLILIYNFDLQRLSANVENEKKEAQKNKEIMIRLEMYLNERDSDRFNKK